MSTIQAPAVARRDGRHPEHPLVVVNDDGIQYEGGLRADQLDPLYDVLWEMWDGPTDGLPVFGEFDAEVQREAAGRRLCAYCLKRPEIEPGAGALWLLHADPGAWPWPATIETTTPTICRKHAKLALERCATLRRGYLAVRVREVEPIGVIGTLYTDGGPAGPDERVLFTDTSRLPFVLARYLLLQLRDAVPDSVLHPPQIPAPRAAAAGASCPRGIRGTS
ncbi:hypothetical protein ABT024_04905 [Streptomyces sp. NPDC002812]|uniref:hypothetical protein n=1 Tax=Streptomyces sp. NPDC002812 TaxID=3154434 RepID=UPI0033299A53